MRELGQPEVRDGDEVGRRSEAARCAFGLLHQPVHRFDEGVGSMVEHAAHDGVEVLRQGSSQPLERLQPSMLRRGS